MQHKSQYISSSHYYHYHPHPARSKIYHRNSQGGNHNDRVYLGAQFVPMGGEMPILRGQNQSYHARGNRGSGGGIGRGWIEKSYVQRSQTDSLMTMVSNQEADTANWYAQVPNLTHKNNFCNKKDQYSRVENSKAQANSKKETNYSKESKKLTEIPNGISVVMCEYERSGPKSIGAKKTEDKPPPPPPALPSSTNPPANGAKAGNQDQQNPQPKPHRPHHNRNNFSRNNHGTNRGQQTAHFNSMNPSTTSNASAATNGTKTHTSNKRRSYYRHSFNGGAQRAIRGRFQGAVAMEPQSDTLCFESLDMPHGFQTRFVNMEIKQTPGQLFTGGRWDKLSGGIWERFFESQQKDSTLKSKIHLWQYLWSMVKCSFPQFGLFLVGSTVTGFGCDTSDVDLCLLVRQSHMDQRSEAVVHLEQILSIIRHCEFVVDPTIIQAKVPILKFREFREGFEVDLNCNNCVGIRNSHLLYCYSQIDWRVRPLVLVVKRWAHRHNINEAKNMTISSYSLVLMVIFFLQSGVSPPILPCLHSMYPEKFTSDSDVDRIDLHEQLHIEFDSINKQSLGELLFDFLDYYAHFNYDEFAISVRLADKVPIEVCRQARSYNNDPHQWKHLCIEEPFDLTNTARSVYDPEIFEKVKNVFLQSYSSLEKSYSIESIFNLDMNT